MKRSLALFGALAGGFLLLTGFAGGGCGRHHGPRSPEEVQAMVGEHLDDALARLKATDAQKQQLHAIKDKLVADGLALRQDHDAVRAELLAQWKADRPDAARLHALVDLRIDALRAFAHEAVDSGIQAHGVLTPEQRAQVTARIERHTER